MKITLDLQGNISETELNFLLRELVQRKRTEMLTLENRDEINRKIKRVYKILKL